MWLNPWLCYVVCTVDDYQIWDVDNVMYLSLQQEITNAFQVITNYLLTYFENKDDF